MGCNTNNTRLPYTIINGDDGINGVDGKNAINAILSNENFTFNAANDGAVSVYTGSGTEVRVYDGETLIPYDGSGTVNNSWKAVLTATNITAGSLTDSGSYLTVGNHSAVAAGVEYSKILYTITGKTSAGNSFTITKEQNFSKSKLGNTGADGTVKSSMLFSNTTITGFTFGTSPSQVFIDQNIGGGVTSLTKAGDNLDVYAVFASTPSIASTRAIDFMIGASNLWPFQAVANNIDLMIARINITRLTDTSATIFIEVTSFIGSNAVDIRQTGAQYTGLPDLDSTQLLRFGLTTTAGTLSHYLSKGISNIL
jgi:hypothetical protein